MYPRLEEDMKRTAGRARADVIDNTVSFGRIMEL